ncbi:MAG: hypothetical protein R3C61_08190 [Bacteroidia bacterium]
MINYRESLYIRRGTFSQILTLIMILLLGCWIVSCKSDYTKDEAKALYSKIRPNLKVLVEDVGKLEKTSYGNTDLVFSLSCVNGMSECWITFDKDSTFVDRRESRIFHFEGGKYIGRNVKDQFSEYVESVFTDISIGLEKLDIETLNIHENNNILIYLNDDEGLFYPLNVDTNFKYQLGCSNKTIKMMINNQAVNNKPYIFPIGDGWYYIAGIFCHGIN